MDTVKDLIAFARPFYLDGDFDTYDEFNQVVMPLLTDELETEFSNALRNFEKNNPDLLKKYVEYFSYKYEVDLDTIWNCYSDDINSN
ncbi:hypothetical protein [Nostoc sp.]|uniref:hypothetical protein n=1 Tax=Nostoc sp. TaxID=1180 RepID=UPI002FF45AF7